MKRNKILILSSIVILSMFVYVRSQNEQDAEKQAPAASVIPAITVKAVLESLDRQLVNLQKKIAEHAERLPLIFAKWKREGKMKLAEQWHQTNHAITQLASELKQIANNQGLTEKLRRDNELFTLLVNLNKEAKAVSQETLKDTAYMMKLAFLFGKSVFTDKLLEKIKAMESQKEPEKKAGEIIDTSYGSYDPFDQFSSGAVDGDYAFEEDFSFDDFGDFDDFDSFDDYGDFGDFDDDLFGAYGSGF